MGLPESGSPGGWVSVALSDGRFDGARSGWSLRSPLAGAAGGDGAGDAGVVAVDIPLGLLDTGWRRADAEASALLGGLRSSVFRVPPRAVWQEERYEAANRQPRSSGPRRRNCRAVTSRPRPRRRTYSRTTG
ncbi:DUF429 domain-containing protein [Streptomyces sp. I6]|nr:DUF429 domain-containing protein [Streptomyces sp. I6]